MCTVSLYSFSIASSIILVVFYKHFRAFIKKYAGSNSVPILYKSEHFIIVNKPYDLKINSNNKNEETVQTILRNMFPSIANKKLYHEFYFPHRLDYATSGILCIPLHKKACTVVSDAFHERHTKKYYIGIVRGLISQETLNIDLPIGEDTRGKDVQKMCTANTKFCVKPRNSRTAIIVLERGVYKHYPATKILARLITGRRHQIRTHCHNLGHTIVGDFTYSNKKDVHPPRMFLHAIRLVLPNTIESMDIETEDPFKNFEGWRKIHALNDLNSAYYKLDEFVKSYK